MLHQLNPVLTRQGDDEAECLSVEFSIAKQKFLCVAGYGPQVGDTKERKEKYRSYMDEEVKTAKKEGKKYNNSDEYKLLGKTQYNSK